MVVDRPHMGFEILVERGQNYEIFMNPDNRYSYTIDNGHWVIHAAGNYTTPADAFRACRSWMRGHQNEVFK